MQIPRTFTAAFFDCDHFLVQIAEKGPFFIDFVEILRAVFIDSLYFSGMFHFAGLEKQRF